MQEGTSLAPLVLYAEDHHKFAEAAPGCRVHTVIVPILPTRKRPQAA